MTNKEIGKQLKQRRVNLGMELQDVQDYTGITISALSNIENGKANPTVKTLEKITDVLGLEITTKIKGND